MIFFNFFDKMDNQSRVIDHNDNDNEENPFDRSIPKFSHTLNDTYLRCEILNDLIEALVISYNPRIHEIQYADVVSPMVAKIFDIIIDNIEYILTKPKDYIESDEYQKRNIDSLYNPIANILIRSDYSVYHYTNDAFKRYDKKEYAQDTIYKFMYESMCNEVDGFIKRLMSKDEMSDER